MTARISATKSRNKSNKIISIKFPRFDGGLNLQESEFRLDVNESPETVNLWWEDGCLQSRPGQEWAAAPLDLNGNANLENANLNGDSNGETDDEEETGGAIPETPSDLVGYAAYQEDFHRRIFLHIGMKLYILDFNSGVVNSDGLVFLSEKYAGVPPNPGTFFRFGENLYYKNQGAFLKIAYNATTDDFNITDAAQDAYIPTVMIDTNPETGIGDSYQPANRISDLKRALYQADGVSVSVVRYGNGTSRIFPLLNQNQDSNQDNNQDNNNYDRTDGLLDADAVSEIESVYIDRSRLDAAFYQFNKYSRDIIFLSPPPENSMITVAVKLRRVSYRLPVLNPEDIIQIRVDKILLNFNQDYILENGLVKFQSPPPKDAVIDIIYRQADSQARSDFMNCPYAAVYGAGESVCIAAGGSPDCPGDVFWSGDNLNAPDPSYWPVSHVLKSVSDTDRVTGFGEQYDQFLIFRARSVGKLENNKRDISGMNFIYKPVNHHIGCDLPGSIKLIHNNLIFCNTSGGVYRIRSASAAYENNIELISNKINGDGVLNGDNRPGLLYDLQVAASQTVQANQAANQVNQAASAFYDGQRYWLCINHHAWVWDTALSENKNNKNQNIWFYFTGFNPAAWFRHDGKFYYLNTSGRVTRLGRYFHDYGNPIHKIYQFPVQNFGSYDRLKNILDIIISMRADTTGEIAIYYETDWERREDLIKIQISGWDRLSERDLSNRDLSQCRRVRHFSVRLENNKIGENLSILSAEILARLAGRDK